MIGLVAALVVLVGGVAAALTREDTTATRTAPGIVSSTQPSPVTLASTTRSTLGTLPPTPFSTTSMTIKPAVPTPEASANGLWAAYTAANRTAAIRFANAEVIDLLFSTPFDGDDGTFQGCRQQRQGVFDCGYSQPSTQYTMTAQSDAAG
ncbi:MAG: hypothetical protein QOG39_1850, partial [Acidimicrobiaceae bacterium]